MQRYLSAAPSALGLAFFIGAATAQPVTTFDGSYEGSLTLGPSGQTNLLTGVDCAEGRPAEMSIHNGYVFLSYHDWKRHVLHYRGRVAADGTIKAYHRNGDGSTSVMTGTVSGNQFTGDMLRGRCPYAVALTKG